MFCIERLFVQIRLSGEQTSGYKKQTIGVWARCWKWSLLFACAVNYHLARYGFSHALVSSKSSNGGIEGLKWTMKNTRGRFFFATTQNKTKS